MDVCFKKKKSSRITHLPDDSWYLIFDKLNKKYDRDSFGLTCHRFLAIQNLSRKSLNLGSNIDILEQLLIRFSRLQSLSLARCSQISDSDLTLLHKYGSQLLSVSLSNSRQVSDVGLTLVGFGCPLLSVICLSRCSITDNGLEILTKSCKSLIEVNLDSCVNITDRGILSLNQNCRHLRALNIGRCIKVTGVGFEKISPTLTVLEADYCMFDSAGFTAVINGGGLEYLNLSFPRRKHGLSFRIGSGNAVNLKILDFNSCGFVNDDAIISISKVCPLLEEWNLSSCNNVGIYGWESIGLYCQKLKRLHVNRCMNLCDRGLHSLGNGCKRLSVIYIYHCSKITSSGKQLFRRQRKKVKIEDSEGMTNFPYWCFKWPFSRCFIY